MFFEVSSVVVVVQVLSPKGVLVPVVLYFLVSSVRLFDMSGVGIGVKFGMRQISPGTLGMFHYVRFCRNHTKSNKSHNASLTNVSKAG